MSGIDDKALHDWVRQTLADYQPPYDPQDWQQLNRRWRKRRWLQRVGVFSLLLLMGVGAYVVSTKLASNPTVDTTHSAPTTNRRLATERSAVTPPMPVPTSEHTARVAIQRREQRTRRALRQVDTKKDCNQRETVTPLTPVLALPERTYELPVVRYELPTSAETTLARQVLSEDIGSDSTVLHALERNLSNWRSSVIVCDLTTSMGPYAAQLYAWFRRNGRNSAVLGTVFFTDCDSLGHETRPGGLPGAFFVTRERNARLALPVMLAATRNTIRNELDAENVVEALRYAQRTFPQAHSLVLLTDNSSGVKDMNLLADLTKPVHVIACGGAASLTDAFGPDQYQIAQKTGGSLHTLEDDLIQPGQIPNRTFIRLGTHYYRYAARKGRFVLTRRTHRPLRFLGINW